MKQKRTHDPYFVDEHKIGRDLHNHHVNRQAQDSLKKIKNNENNNIFKIVGLIALAVVSLFFLDKIQTVIIVGLLFLGATILPFHRLIIGFNVGLELRTLLLVVVGFKIGIIYAIVLTVSSVILGNIISFNFQPTALVSPIVYTIIAFLIPPLSGLGIIATGLIIMVIYNIIVHGTYYLLLGYHPVQSLTPLIGNLLINTFLFMRFAVPIAASIS